MPYTDHYKLADDIIEHLDTVIGGISDPFIASRYVGLVALAAVTVYELAIKDIFISFGEKTHKVLGNFTRMHFDRINGIITIDNICKDYICRFGDEYLEQFNLNLKKAEDESLIRDKVSIKSSDANIIGWRHGFVHEGKLPSTATYDEAIKSYKIGKEVIRCLADAMEEAAVPPPQQVPTQNQFPLPHTAAPPTN